jgi:rhodanese-related sulfurtransferase
MMRFGRAAMQLKKGVKELVTEAEAIIETMTVEKVKAARADPNVQLVDVRDIRELWRDGGIPGAYHAPRGMLEFWVDPESPYHKEIFASGKKFVLFCAGGLRSALAAKALHDMGLGPVAHMAGGFGAWVKAGGPVEKKEPPPPKPQS